MGKWMSFVKISKQHRHFLDRKITGDRGTYKNAAGKIATPGHKTKFNIIIWL
jgi:hypothetical protein